MKNLLKQLPIQILLVVVIAIVFTPFLSKDILRIFYSISCLFKDALMIFLPILVFSYMFSSMMKFAKSAPMLIFAILITVTLSNVAAFGISFYLCKFFMSFLDLTSGIDLTTQTDSIESLTALPIPGFWAPKNSMIAGLILGIIFSFVNNKKIDQFSNTLKGFVTNIFNGYFIPALPLFIFGFFVKLQYEGAIKSLFLGYGKVLIVVMPIYISYFLILFLLANKFSFSDTMKHIKDSSTAFLTGFSTTSSLAAMPLMFKTAEKHTASKDYVEFMIPSTINIHAIGDGLIFAATAAATIYLFDGTFPTFPAFMVFLYYYGLAKFSTAAVPAGSALVLTPLVVSYFGFSYKMSAIFLTLGILQDCIETAGNVLGNIWYVKFSYNLFGKKILK
ncbi:MAG: cation:dicarboxylase symporter family transporter [Alphaproteobacteria bacterium]|nr:MAG: cation:dicarboxylase symporter family transporter [Alphaproteobacteria bacterium]